MISRSLPLVLAAAVLLAPTAGYAQTSGGYLSVAPALSAGDGGAAPALSVSAGYVTPHRIGFEVEFGYTDRLDLRDDNGPRIMAASGLFTSYPGMPVDSLTALGLMPITTVFPLPDFTVTGRLLSLQTNATGELVTTRRMRASVSAGGGVGALRQRVHFRIPSYYLPVPLGMPPQQVRGFERTDSATDTGLSLDAGLTMEYRMTRRIGIAGDVRYQHVFVNNGGLDLARVGGRLLWRF